MYYYYHYPGLSFIMALRIILSLVKLKGHIHDFGIMLTDVL